MPDDHDRMAHMTTDAKKRYAEEHPPADIEPETTGYCCDRCRAEERE